MFGYILSAVKNYMMGNFFVGMMNDLLPEKYQLAYLDIKKVGEYTVYILNESKN